MATNTILKNSNISTVKDVAEKAGISTTTVSHVINTTRFVSDDLAKRVDDAVRELDYQPSKLARSLRTKASGTIGIVIPDSTNPFFAERVQRVALPREMPQYRSQQKEILVEFGFVISPKVLYQF